MTSKTRTAPSPSSSSKLAPLTGLTAITIAAFLLVACSQPGTSAGYGDPVPAPANDPQISVLSEDLRPWLGFQPAVIIDDDDRPMQVQVPVRNLADRQYLIDYRFIFYDRIGMEIEPAMGWAMTPIMAKQTVRLKGGALDTRAQRYRLEVKWAR